jgi:hypothetical protein
METRGTDSNLPDNGDSTRNVAEEDSVESRFQAQKKLVEQLKVEWKQLWTERFNDKAKAEDVSVSNYESLKVERGTIIHATRDFKPLNFKDILDQHKVDHPESFIAPDINVGGWTKFVKAEIHPNKPSGKTRQSEYLREKKAKQQPKKNGRGWLHKK